MKARGVVDFLVVGLSSAGFLLVIIIIIIVVEMPVYIGVLIIKTTLYPQALYHDLVFELTFAPALQVAKGSDTTKLAYKLTNIQMEGTRPSAARNWRTGQPACTTAARSSRTIISCEKRW